MTDNLIHIESFEDLNDTIEDNELLLLDFYADWCGPCKMMNPVVEEISEETEANVAKIDIDKHEDIASEFGVRSVPTFGLVVGDEIKESFVGAKSKEFVEGVIAEYT